MKVKILDSQKRGRIEWRIEQSYSEVSKKAKVIQITDALIVVEYTRSKIKESFVRVQLADAKILVSAGMESSTWT